MLCLSHYLFQVIEAEEDGDLDQQLPGAWRTDNFLEKYTDESFSSLASHRLEFLKEKDKKDAMARNHDDDYVVSNPIPPHPFVDHTDPQKVFQVTWLTEIL